MANEKRCRVCGEAKTLEHFTGQATKKNPHRLRNECRPCANELGMQHRDKNADMHLNSHLIRRFGITLDQFNAMVESQNGVCAICGEPPTIQMGIRSRRQGRATRPRLVVDHCHRTGVIRGLLCTPCNRGIGFLNDDPKRVLRALEYLEGTP